MDTEQATVPYGYCHCGCGSKTRIATQNHAKSEHVRGQPVRFIRGHQFRGQRVAVRYLEEDRGHDTPCWIWRLWVNPGGYGIEQAGSAPRLAHRVYYERARGPIPPGLQLDHLCRVRACVNPAHLEPVTNAENQRRGRNAKLTMEDAAAIRCLHGDGVSKREIARRFGVSPNRILEIVRGLAWV